MWRYQSGNQYPYIEEGHTISGPKEKEQTTMIYKTLNIKLKIEQHEPHSKPEWTRVLLKGN